MKPTMRLILLTCCSVFLLGCSNSVIQSRDREYLSAKSIPPLRIPPGISSSSFQSTYPVSERYYPENAKNISLVPPGLVEKS